MTMWRWIGALALIILGACGSMGGDRGPVLIDSGTAGRLHGVEWQLKTITVEGTRVIMHTDGDMSLVFAADGQAGGYSADRYVSSCLAGAPAESPRAVVLVSVCEPKADGEPFGGVVAAPAAAAVLDRALQLEGSSRIAGGTRRMR